MQVLTATPTPFGDNVIKAITLRAKMALGYAIGFMLPTVGLVGVLSCAWLVLGMAAQ